MSLASKVLHSIAGKTVLVTGGGSGLGEAAARYLAAEGAKIAILDVNEKGGIEVAKAIGGKFVRTDVSSEADVAAAIKIATDSFGPLFGCVNCAGIVGAVKVIGKKGAHPLSGFESIIRVNLVGTFNVCRLAAQSMAEKEVGAQEDRGVIVNTASIAAFDGQMGQTAYSASKGGIVSLTLPMARDLASYRIRVNTVCPGVMGTPMLASLPQPARESLEKSVPYPSRLGDPMEYAALVHHIMSNQYINGECIRLDGSLRMAPR